MTDPDHEKQTGTHVWLAPFGDENPYQRELVARLRHQGFRITTRDWLSGIVASHFKRATRPRLLHHHWLPRFTCDWLGVRIIVGFLLRIVATRLLGTRIVWTVHNLYEHEARWRRIDRWVTKVMVACSARLIVHSPTASRLVGEEFAIRSPEKIVVIPHGNYLESYPRNLTREEARRRLGVPLDAHVVLFFGMIRAYKGVPDLIRAHKARANPGTVLVIAGKPAGADVTPMIEGLVEGDSTIVFRPGFVADDEVHVHLTAADVVVCPFTSILTSGSVVLAMSFGRPCIAPAIGCIPDFLDERGGFPYQPEEPGALAGALADAFARRDELEAMGRHNLARAREWSWERVGRETAAVYHAALGSCAGAEPSAPRAGVLGADR